MHSKPAKLAAEFIGTLGLVLLSTGAICADQFLKSGNQPGLGPLGTALAYGLAVGGLFTSIGHISGGHFNPAVTIGFWVARRLGTFEALAYVAAQLAGTAAASYLLRFAVPDEVWEAVALGTPGLASGVTRASGMLIEGSLTFFLVLIIFAAVADPHLGGLAGPAIGAVVAAAAMCGAPFTGGVLNPARAFGPALAAHRWNNQAVYWIGPLAGGLVAASLYHLLFSTGTSRPHARPPAG
jgi:MIP family channel proteins